MKRQGTVLAGPRSGNKAPGDRVISSLPVGGGGGGGGLEVFRVFQGFHYFMDFTYLGQGIQGISGGFCRVL